MQPILNFSKRLSSCLLTLCIAFNSASAAEDKFSSEAFGLLTPKQSKEVSEGLLNGVGASGDIRAHVPKERLQEFHTFFDSGILMTSFPINKENGDAYLLEVKDRMSSLSKIEFIKDYAPGAGVEPDGAVMTMVSLVPTADDRTMMEVTIVAFDWKKTVAKKNGMQGVRESVIWHGISRKILPLPSKGVESNWGENPMVKEAYLQMVDTNLNMFLVAF